MKKIAIKDLKVWEDNPRDLTDSAYNQLISQLLLGEIENLVIMSDGTVLNGNMRLRAYRELGIEEATVAELEFVPAEGGGVNVKVDGKLAERRDEGHKGDLTTFDSKEQGMLHYAIAGNVHVGVFNDGLLEQLSTFEITEDMFQLHMTPGTRAEDLIRAIGPMSFPSSEGGIEEREVDVSPVERELDSYENGTIKQIVVYFTNDQYLALLPRLDAINKARGFKNNTETFLAGLDALEEIG